MYGKRILAYNTKIGSNLRKFWKNWVILHKIFPKSGQMVYEWVTFSWKIGICMGLLSNSVVACPYQNQIWVPPRVLNLSLLL